MNQFNAEGDGVSPPLIFDDLPVALFRSHPDGALFAVNKAFRELTGYVDDAALRKLYTSDLYANLDERSEKLALLFSQGFVRNAPFTLRRFDGSVINTFFNVNLVYNADGQVQFLEGAIHEADENEWANNQLQHRLALETFAADLSARLIGLAVEDSEREIIDALGQLAKLTGDERIHINLMDPGTNQIVSAMEWVKEGLLKFGRTLPPDFYNRRLPWVMSILARDEIVHLPDCLRDTPPDAVHDIEWWQEKGRKSSLLIPIVINNQLKGVFGCHNDTINKTWDAADIRIYQLVGEIILGVLLRIHTEQDLKEGEQRFRQLFEDSPMTMWEQDFSELKRHLDGLQREGVSNIREYFESYPKEAQRCMGMIKSVRYNRSVAELLHTKKIEDLDKLSMKELFMGLPSKGYVDELTAVAEGQQFFENEVIYPAIDGVQKHAYFRWSLSPDLEEPYRSVIVTGMDISRRKQLEEQTRRQMSLETLVAQISAELIDVAYADIDAAIHRVLEETGNFMGDDRVFLDLYEGPIWDAQYGFEWRREGLPKYEGISHDWMQRFTWLQGQLKRMETVHIPSVAADFPPEAEAEKQQTLSIGRKSLLFIPISMHNQLAGLLGCVTEFREKAWGDDDIRMLRLVGEALVSVLLRKQAETALQRRIEAEELVFKISTRFIGLPFEEIDEQIESSLVEVAKFMGSDRVFIDLIAEDKPVFTHIYEWFSSDQTPFPSKPKYVDLRKLPWMSNELENMRSINISNITNKLPPDAYAEKEMLLETSRKSILMIPFSINNRFAGVLGCSTRMEEKNWPVEDINILQLASEIYASVLIRKKAEKALRERDMILNRQVKELQVLNAVAEVSAAARDEQMLIDDVTQLIITSLYPANYLTLLLDETTGLLNGRVFMQSDEDYELLDISDVLIDVGVVSDVLKKRKPRRFVDIRRSPQEPIVDSLARSLLCAPMIAGEHNIGVINVESRNVGAFTEGDERFLTSLAGQLATAITRVRFLNAEHSRRKEMEELVEFTRSLRNVETIPEIEEVTAEMPASILGADVAALLLPKGRHLVIAEGVGLGKDFIGEKYSYDESSSPLWHSALAGKPLYLNLNLPTERATAPAFLDNMGHAIIIPLKTSNQVHGLLCLGLSGPMKMTTSVERNLIDAISDVAGNALYRAQVMETLEQRVRDRTQMLYLVYEIVAILNKPIHLSEMLHNVLDGMMEVVSGSSGFIHLIKDDPGAFELEVERNVPEEAVNNLKVIPLKDQSWDWHQWLLSPEAPHVVADLPVRIYFPEVLRLEGFLTYVGLPIFIQEQLVGFVSLYGHSADNIRSDSLEFLRTLSEQVAYAIEKNRLQKALELNAVVNERQRLAGDLHDSVLQSLYSVNLMAKAAHTLAGNDQWERSRHYLAELGETMQKALKEMRLLIYELRPSALETEGLEEALRQRLKVVKGRIGAHTELVGSTQLNIPRHIEECLYQIAVEALNNVVKHSEATSVSVRTALSGGRVSLDISDNGIGFEYPTGMDKGIGLSIMGERVREIKGHLDVISTSGVGTTIRVTVDL
jgi:PAS domain S-box-containing protein